MIGATRSPVFLVRQIEALRAAGLEVELLPEIPGGRIGKTLLAEGWTRLVPRRLSTLVRRADVVHYQWPSAVIMTDALARRFRRPRLVSLRGRQVNVIPHLPGQERHVSALRRVLPGCEHFHSVSEAMIEEAVHLGVARERCRVIRTGVDVDRFAPVPRSPSPMNTVAMVGGLNWVKGYEYALLAFARLIDSGRDATLRIAGGGPERDRLIHTISQLGLGPHVELLGPLEVTDVRLLLGESDVFLHSGLSEGIPNAVIEAMACGLPVVATDVGGTAEAITDGTDGFLVQPRDVKGMSARLAHLLDDPTLRIAVGSRARTAAVERFDMRSWVRAFLDLYGAVADT
jgi:glycosyltransferase involved in cell wall biosynthesis